MEICYVIQYFGTSTNKTQIQAEMTYSD